MTWSYNTNYPGIDDLRNAARRRIPRFAFEYLDGGCNEDVNLAKNTSDIRDVELKPYYLGAYTPSDLKTELFGQVYDAPFGVSPIGLQGLVWPNSPEILARAATDHNIPFTLSTVSTSSIERIAEITGGKAWFQLYYPSSDEVRADILRRVESAHLPVLVLLSDVPTFAFRPRDIKNGLALPPRMTLRNIIQILGKPNWALRTLYHGAPHFATMKQYMPGGLNMKQLGQFMNMTFSGRLSEERIGPIRERWKGKLVIKGVASEEDTETAIRLGIDGIIISNHGGRQLDAGESTLHSLVALQKKYKGKIKIMLDSGVRTGPDIARVLASGADFVFLGRTFMYGVAALGNEGGNHTMSILKIQLKQILEQVCCAHPSELYRHLIPK